MWRKFLESIEAARVHRVKSKIADPGAADWPCG
jgi:hypothetical protein